MAKKNESSLLNNLKNRRDVTRQGVTPVVELTKEVIVENVFRKQEELVEVYESRIDYSIFEIDEEQTQKLKECEKIAVRGMKRTAKALLEIGEAFKEAQAILVHDKKGGFLGWYEALGLKKDFVYMTLNRYSLYLEQNRREEIASLPDRVIKAVVSKKLNLTEKEIKSIIFSEEPLKTLKEVKSQHSVGTTVSVVEEIEEAVIVETVENVEYSLEERKEKLRVEIEELERMLEQKREELGRLEL